jgi:putative oxidoreductase
MKTKLFEIITSIINLFSSLRALPPLFFRAILVYGFYGPAIMKIQNFDSVVQWFENDLHLPLPYLNAVMAVSTELTGLVLLTLGLATRFISFPLIVVMLVAIKTVHLEHGFSCGDNGFEVPFYYIFMLFSLIISGAGRVSVDYLIRKKAS